MRTVAAIAIALLLIACRQAPAAALPHVEATAASSTVPADAVIEDARSATTAIVAPTMETTREVVQAVVAPPPAEAPKLLSPAAVDHIIRWEVTSRSHYTRALQRPIWPGGASGVTWGIGYDGGHQTRLVILDDWTGHPERSRLAETAGITGQAARAALPRFRDILTPYDIAERVFIAVSLPIYHRSTVRAYGTGLLQLPPDAVGALVGNTYNRGGSMVGSRNAEKRHIRDTCIPAGDLACIAAQLRAQCRLWSGTSLEAGLCGRRDSEARLVERAL